MMAQLAATLSSQLQCVQRQTRAFMLMASLLAGAAASSVKVTLSLLYDKSRDFFAIVQEEEGAIRTHTVDATI
jgi:hypothetical protein